MAFSISKISPFRVLTVNVRSSNFHILSSANYNIGGFRRILLRRRTKIILGIDSDNYFPYKQVVSFALYAGVSTLVQYSHNPRHKVNGFIGFCKFEKVWVIFQSQRNKAIALNLVEFLLR